MIKGVTIRVEFHNGDRPEQSCRGAVALADKLGCCVMGEWNGTMVMAFPGNDPDRLARKLIEARQCDVPVACL